MSQAAHHAASRYAGDVRLLERILSDPELNERVPQAHVEQRREHTRALLLAQGVHVTPQVMPELHAMISALAESAGLEVPIETYVIPDRDLNAAMSRGPDCIYLMIHAGALDALDDAALRYLLGHELGHVIHEHVDVMQRELMDDASIGPRRRLLLHAWSRAAEISADRVGLLACRDPEAAGRANFRLATGITGRDYGFDAASFAAQWDRYAREVRIQGSDHFEGLLTHPLPPLRMKALLAFWESGLAEGDPGSADWQARCRALDAEIDDWLALLDPLARDDPGRADPLLEDFLLWGGLHVSLADGALREEERRRLVELVPPERVEAALEELDGAENALSCFRETLASRRDKLTSAEIYRIVDALAQIVWCDRALNEAEQAAMRTITDLLGVVPDLVLERHQPGELQ